MVPFVHYLALLDSRYSQSFVTYQNYCCYHLTLSTLLVRLFYPCKIQYSEVCFPCLYASASMSLIYELGLDILNVYLHTRSKVSRSRLSKVRAKMGQTHK